MKIKNSIVTIRLSAELKKQLQETAEQRKMSMSGLIDQMIKFFLYATNKNTKPNVNAEFSKLKGDKK